MAVSCLNKAAEILVKVNRNTELAEQCRSLAAEVKTALRAYAVHQHPKYGPIYAYEMSASTIPSIRTRAASCGARTIPISFVARPVRALAAHM